MAESYKNKYDDNYHCKNFVYTSKNEYSAKKIYGICMNRLSGTKNTKKYTCIRSASYLVTNYGAKERYADCLKKDKE